MIHIRTAEEIEPLHQAAQVVSRTLGLAVKEAEPRVTTPYLDKIAEEYTHSQGATLGFLGLYGFPNTLCMNPNVQVVRGTPSDHPLQEGDIISIDCGALKNGHCGDHAYTFEVSEVAPEVKELLCIIKESLYIGIRRFRVGNRVGDMGHAIQQHCEAHGYGVVHELVEHGVGRKMHEGPEIPNYGKRDNGKKFKDGMVVAIEPMINMGTKSIRQLRDSWTILTADGKPSAHSKHDVAPIDGKSQLLSTFKYIHKALGIEGNEGDEFLLN